MEGFLILHLADIHIRDTGRDMFQRALAQLSTYIKDIRDKRRVIAVIAGDIFHYKTRLSGENVTDCYALLDCLAERASDIVIIPGNHDANINACGNDKFDHDHDRAARIDLLTPILTNCRELPGGCALHYWSHSGWQDVLHNSLQFYVFSPLSRAVCPSDQSATPYTRVALIHDFVEGLKIQGSNGHGAIRQEWLTQFHCVMCGHSHDYQEFTLANQISLVYCGALTQLNLGESFDKGIVAWDFFPNRTITHKFIRLNVAQSLVKYIVTAVRRAQDSSGGSARRATDSIRITCNNATDCEIPQDAARVIIELRSRVPSDCPEVRALTDKIHKTAPHIAIEFVIAAENVANEISQRVSDGSTMNVQNELIEAKLRSANSQIDAATVRDVLALHSETLQSIVNGAAGSDRNTPGICPRVRGNIAKWALVFLEWSDLFCYGSDNHIDFSNVTGLSGVIAPNRCGKSSIIDILALALFNKTLRGSATSIIRRGQREGSLRCVWDTISNIVPLGDLRSANPPLSRHEIVRRWDLKGHTMIQYFVDGQNRTETDLKMTYVTVEKSVGSLTDFLSAVLIPQHSDMSFLDATDQQRRNIIARILGLDLLDASLNITKERERDHQQAIKTLSALIHSAITRIKATRVARFNARDNLVKTIAPTIASATTATTVVEPSAERAANLVRSLLDDDAHAIEENYQCQIKSAREYVQHIKEHLESLEAMPSVGKPSHTRDEIDREIRTLSGREAQLNGELSDIDARVSVSRANLESLTSKSGAAAIGAGGAGAMDADRAKLARLMSRVDQQMLLLGRAKGISLDEVPSRIATATKILNVLLEMKAMLTGLMEMDRQCRQDKHREASGFLASADAEFRELSRICNAPNAPSGSATPQSREEIIARRKFLSSAGVARKCRCATSPFGIARASQRDREFLVEMLQCRTFATGVAIPGTIPTDIDSCLKKMRDIIAGADGAAGVSDSARSGMSSAALFDLAYCAIRMIRASANGGAGNASRSEAPVDSVPGSLSGLSEADAMAAFEDAKYCCANHDKITAGNLVRAELTYLDALDEHMNIMERADNKAKLRAFLISAVKEFRSLSASRSDNGTQNDSNSDAPPIPSIDVINDNIFACERTLATLGELRMKDAQIREAMAADTEIAALRSRIDAGFAISKLTAIIEDDTKAIAAIKGRIADTRAAVDALKAQIEPAIAERREYDAFVARQGEIKAQRELFARGQTAYLSLVAEASEYAQMRDSLSDANRNIAKEHQAIHLCQLYRMTLDTKTGIQYNLMTSAIHLIEEEANRILDPVAGLQLDIQLGTTNGAIGAVGTTGAPVASPDAACANVSRDPGQFGATTSSNGCAVIPYLSHGSMSKTMRIQVRDIVTGIEHPAELCSGFQRFILNIAIRRAFLRTAVRPMPQFMIIDEGFGCLDEANMARICERLPDLACELRFMLIISHIDHLNTLIANPMIIEVDPHGGQRGGSISAIRFGPAMAHSLPAPRQTGRASDATPHCVRNSASASAKERKKHNAAPAVVAIDPAIVDRRSDGSMFCKICGIDFTVWTRHARTKKHIQYTARHVTPHDRL